MILHTLNASPASPAFDDCMALLKPGDALLLIGDGVYAALSGTAACEALLGSGADIHMLEDDARAAGVLGRTEHADAVDIEGFVRLTERFEQQLAWY